MSHRQRLRASGKLSPPDSGLLQTPKANLQEISDVGIGPFGVGTRNFKERTLLANHKDVHQLPDVVALPCPDNQKVRFRHLVEIDGSPEEVVLKRLTREKQPCQSVSQSAAATET